MKSICETLHISHHVSCGSKQRQFKFYILMSHRNRHTIERDKKSNVVCIGSKFFLLEAFLKKTRIKNKNTKFNMSGFFGLRTSSQPHEWFNRLGPENFSGKMWLNEPLGTVQLASIREPLWIYAVEPAPRVRVSRSWFRGYRRNNLICSTSCNPSLVTYIRRVRGPFRMIGSSDMLARA